MLSRKFMIPALFILLSGLTGVAATAAPVTVVLEGHDQPVTGYLRSISASRFLLQGEDDYLEFDAGAPPPGPLATSVAEAVAWALEQVPPG